MPVVRACALVGYSRASFYRHRSPRARLAAPIPQKDRHQPATLSTAESAQILALINTPEYEGFSICQAFYRAWDAGVYLASKSSWYRVARAAGQVHERRRQAEGSPKKIPELVATAPSQVWSWDITKLKTTIRGRYFHLYVIMDIYSRRVVGWRLEAYEDGDLAEELIQEAVTANHGVAPNSLHSDNGAAMVSTPVSLLLEKLGVDKSFSRPKVSNDNPYSEALFKTAKYDLAFPEIFDTTDDARAYFDWFFHEYNQNHRHSGIAWNTPTTFTTAAPTE
ncbi:DDE-type integrase/transposase/recombinase [Cryobacterium sp. PAMC25264]|nr:DDE-type integrase/transposase/recombinase [Cryobacterium sp. PAMC25264]